MNIRKIKKNNLLAAGGLLAAVILPVVLQAQTQAASLSTTYVRFDRIQTSTPTTGTVCAKPATVATEASVQVTFPTGYTVATTVLATNWAVDTTAAGHAWPTGGTIWPGIGTAATAAVGQVVTFASTDLTVGTLYCFNWTATTAVTTAAGASSTNTGSVTTRDSGPTTIDTASYVTDTLASDSVIVNATVPQAFTFVLAGSPDSLGTLSSASISQSTGVTATINTNAANGYNVYAKDAFAGLHSNSASKTIAAAAGPLSIGNEGFSFGVTATQTSGTGTPAGTGTFVGGVAGTGGALSSSTLAEVGHSGGGPSNNAVFTLKSNAAISGITPAAADYTDTITIVGAALF